MREIRYLNTRRSILRGFLRFYMRAKCLVTACVFFSVLSITACKDGSRELRKILRSAADSNKKTTSEHEGEDKKRTRQVKAAWVKGIESCPKGSTIKGDVPPSGFTQWCEGTDSDGKTMSEGPMLRWYNNGTPKMSANYKTGKLEGQLTYWHPNGKLKEQAVYLNGERNGEYSEFGREGGKKIIGNYRDGVKSGKFQYFWEKHGQIREEGAYLKDLKEGLWTTYQKNGQIRSKTSWKNGGKNGASEEYSRDGQVLAKGTYKDDAKHGPWIVLYPDGKPKEEGDFAVGEKEGTWTEYSKDGQIHRVMEYQHGTVVRNLDYARANIKRKHVSAQSKFGKGDILGGPVPLRHGGQQAPEQSDDQVPKPITEESGWHSM